MSGLRTYRINKKRTSLRLLFKLRIVTFQLIYIMKECYRWFSKFIRLLLKRAEPEDLVTQHLQTNFVFYWPTISQWLKLDL